MKTHRYDSYSLILLLFSLLLVLLLFPFLRNFTHSSLILKIFLSIVLIAAVVATTHKKLHLIIAFTLGALAFISSWGEFFDSHLAWVTINLIFDILFIGYVIMVHLYKIMTARVVNTNLLYGAMCVYILIGLFMSFIYMLIATYVPDAFNVDMNLIKNGHYAIDGQFLHYLYYSYVTLTTLGFGDITPLTPQVQAVTYLEAIIGQFYLTVLVARLVGLYISKMKV